MSATLTPRSKLAKLKAKRAEMIRAIIYARICSAKRKKQEDLKWQVKLSKKRVLGRGARSGWVLPALYAR